ncbi:MAG: biotin synthase BioB [Magnetococcales bacterium]|nr:biotin synthase BioB [Magnetococcales bacterium]
MEQGVGSGFYQRLWQGALAGEALSEATALGLLTDPDVSLLPLLDAAYQVRAHYFGRKVRVHILNNVQNGLCAEDCNYCAQAAGSEAEIPKFRIKPDEEILEGAERAYQSGAFRYCVVMSGRGPSQERVAHMASLVQRIKEKWPLEVCLSAGFIDPEMAGVLKEAGLDRYNHNLNTSEGRYGSICTTHGYADRVATLNAAKGAGMEVCSGLIIGMGEPPEEVLEVARELKRLNARSIPVNFYVHVSGSKLGEQNRLTPEYCLRVLALFRLICPDAEIRAAGGREVNLGALEALALYPANSLFSEGYLNTGGHSSDRTLKMIREAGFELEKIEEVD